MMKVHSMETAPKGGGAELVTDPAYVTPPKILLFFADDIVSVGYWDWYYAVGGDGYRDLGCNPNNIAWVSQDSGEQLCLLYDSPIAWAPLPTIEGSTA
jgi:hypothetical protein